MDYLYKDKLINTLQKLSIEDDRPDPNPSVGMLSGRTVTTSRVSPSVKYDRFIPLCTPLTHALFSITERPLHCLKQKDDRPAQALYDMSAAELHSKRALRFSKREGSKRGVPASNIPPREGHFDCALRLVGRFDAPDVRDDFYTSLLEVGKHYLALILADTLYLRSHETADIVSRKILSDSWSLSYPTAVGFVSRLCAVGDSAGKLRLFRLDKKSGQKQLIPIPIDYNTRYIGRLAAVTCIAPINSEYFVYGMRGNSGIVLVRMDREKMQARQERQYRRDELITGLACRAVEPPLIAMGKNDGVTEILRFTKGSLKRTHRLKDEDDPHTSGGKALAWHPTEPLLVVGAGMAEGSVKLWKQWEDRFDCVLTIKIGLQITGAVWSKDGKCLLVSTGMLGASLRVYRIFQSLEERYKSKILNTIKPEASDKKRILGLKVGPMDGRVYTVNSDEILSFYSGFNSDDLAQHTAEARIDAKENWESAIIDNLKEEDQFIR